MHYGNFREGLYVNRTDTSVLQSEHTQEAITRRPAATTRHSYLRLFVLGAAVDTVTTIGIVAGAAGAEYAR